MCPHNCYGIARTLHHPLCDWYERDGGDHDQYELPAGDSRVAAAAPQAA